MTDKVLFVDDEPNVLAGYERQLRKRFAVETAVGGEAGAAALDARGPFAVVVSDMRMPGMDGARFLALARARSADTVRVLLTGYADVPGAIDAVNRGGVFRFLTKPCPADMLAGTIDAALAQYRLVTAERELLDKTLRGCVQVLGEVLALVNPAAFGRAVRVRELVRRLAGHVEGGGGWEVEVAAVLSQLGCVRVPDAVLTAAARGADLPPDQRKQLDGVPDTAVDLLRAIPRLDGVLEIIRGLQRLGQPARAPAARDAPVGARLLSAAFDFDALVARGVPERQAVAQLGSVPGRYDPRVLAALEGLFRAEAEPETRAVAVGGLVSGMVLAEDVYSDAGVLLLTRGHPITEALKHRLEAVSGQGRTPRRVLVHIPPAERQAH